MLTTIILTKNEEQHIARALGSVAGIADRCLVVDSGSTDRTVELARGLGAQVLENPWTNHATQFNWALEQLPPSSGWIMRLDADEYITTELGEQIVQFLDSPDPDVDALIVQRRMHFLGRPIRWGGVFPVEIVRLFRQGKGRCEDRWMDEHIIVEGKSHRLDGELIDDNLNPITWWTEKHNAYASREVVDMLNAEFEFMPRDSVADLHAKEQAGFKRWMKERVYARLPRGFRAFAYFLYRYFLRLGFLDGIEGTAFHILQGFWYRYLVDIKHHEVTSHMRSTNSDAVTSIRDKLGLDVRR